MNHNLNNLSKLKLFEGISEDDISNMLSCLEAREKSYSSGSFVRLEGDPADFIGIVLSGTVQILSDDYNGNRSITAAVGQGQLFAEAFACAQVSTLPVSILAVSDCSILEIDIKKVLSPCNHACHFHNQLIQNLLKIVSTKNMLLNQKLSYVSHKTTGEKILAYLRDQAKLHNSDEFMIPFDRQALADYLGVERSAMSAEISKLKKAGVLDTKKNYFRLL